MEFSKIEFNLVVVEGEVLEEVNTISLKKTVLDLLVVGCDVVEPKLVGFVIES